MLIFRQKLLRLLCRIPKFFGLFLIISIFFTQSAHAESIIDAYNLAPFVPLVLDTMMNIATSLERVKDGMNRLKEFIDMKEKENA